jgi:hypothetical protein
VLDSSGSWPTARTTSSPISYPGDLVTVHHAGRDGLTRTPRGRREAGGRGVPADAVTAAVGVTAALMSLNQADITAAGTALRWLVGGARHRGLSVNASNVGWGSPTRIIENHSPTVLLTATINRETSKNSA